MKSKEQVEEALAAYRSIMAEYKYHIRMNHNLMYDNPQEVLNTWHEEISAASEAIDALEYVLGLNEDGLTATIVENTFMEVEENG